MTSSVTGGCPLALVILLLMSMDPIATEVVNSVNDCTEFFLDGTPPDIPGVLQQGTIQDQNRYKPICQEYENTRRFMTLYDTVNKIPVFSAYKYTGDDGSKRPRNQKWIKKYSKQASFSDYTHQTDYDRGHIFPSAHAHHKSDKEATFTLTNIVPQSRTFNNGSWKSMEKCVRCVMHEYCLNQNNQHEAFVVTGAIPNANKTLKNKVNIPKTLWTAFCCYSKVTGEWLASAHWGDNVKENPRAKILMET
uniref:Endonuclease domain-containing 1 protein-like n=1 Tax=Gadus morhua TaxID=8049 RepID=A0A8C4Z2M0_GADMO